MQREPIWERAHGRWPGILRAIGLPEKALRNRHGPCPLPGCGGKDRFRFDDKGDGSWICSKCGAGTGVELVKRYLGVDFKDAAKRIEEHIGDAPIMPTSKGQRQDDGSLRDVMNALWKRAKPIGEHDAAGRWLDGRLGFIPPTKALRQVADERYVEDGKRASWHPAMIARVDPSDAARATGETAALHRTYLTSDGLKADVASARKMLGSMPTGAAVRLMPHGDTLGIAEGIETAFAASKLFGVPVWAALTADLLMAWEPPPAVTTVVVYGDNDASFAGQASAYSLARRLKAKNLAVSVEIPERHLAAKTRDWNDVLTDRRRAS